MIVGAGVVATGVAVLAPFLMRRDRMPGSVSDGITVVPGQARVFANDSAGIESWANLIGRPVRLVGEGAVAFGTIASVVPGAVDSNRPAGMRQKPFEVRFAIEAAGRVPVEGIYDIGTTIEGMSRLFIQPAGPRTVIAFFN
jgi:hypothetical protein